MGINISLGFDDFDDVRGERDRVVMAHLLLTPVVEVSIPLLPFSGISGPAYGAFSISDEFPLEEVEGG